MKDYVMPTAKTDITVALGADGVAMIRIDRPHKRNAMSLAMWRGLASFFADLDSDKSVRSIILTGADGTFCAGADISEFSSLRSTPEDGAAYDLSVEAAEHAIIGSKKPTIAAISGACVGGGLGLALCCDFRFADATAYFAIPAARLGIVYGITETRQLLQAVGQAKAREILFAGRRIVMPEAAAIGLVTHPVDGDVGGAATTFAKTFTTSAPRTIAGAKLILGALAGGSIGERSRDISDAAKDAVSSRDYQEGIAAFAQKREPQFNGD